jgi:hypothetical protein
MASSSIPRDINSINEIIPTIVGYENNHNIGKMQPLHKGGLEMEILDVGGDFDGINEPCVIEMHLENLQK